MLNENIKVTRKNKGLTQEELAIRLNVTRQTVSKWEKGYSVPDAEMLTKLAEVLETSVSSLLGEGMKEEQETNQIAEQLARVNEQLAISNRRWRIIGKVLMAVAIIIVIAIIGLWTIRLLAVVAYDSDYNTVAGRTEWVCTLEDKEFSCNVAYNHKYATITMSSGGDAVLAEQVNVHQYDDARKLAAYLEDYFESRGGTVTMTNLEGMSLPTD